MKTFGEYWRRVRDLVDQRIQRKLDESNVYNHQAWLHGKIASVNADNKFASVYINGATTATPSVPLASHVGTLAANDEVLVLRIQSQSLMVIAKKGAALDGSGSQPPPPSPTIYSGTTNVQYTDGTWWNVLNSAQLGGDGTYLVQVRFASSSNGGTIWNAYVSFVHVSIGVTNSTQAVAIPATVGAHALNGKTIAVQHLATTNTDGKSYCQLRVTGESVTSPVAVSWKAQLML